MGRGIDQRALVVLAVDLDQRRAEALEHLHADRLVVDEGARAAVGELHAAQDQLVLGRRCRWPPGARAPGGRRQRRTAAVTWPCSAPWRTSAASPRAPSASANASSRIDLPAPVSPVSTDKPAGEIDVEPVDQDDVADRKPGQHGYQTSGLRDLKSRCHGARAGHPRTQTGSADVDGRTSSGHDDVPIRCTASGFDQPQADRLEGAADPGALVLARLQPAATAPARRRPCTSGCPGSCGRARRRRSAPRRRCRAPCRLRSAASAPPRRDASSGTASPPP